MVNLIKQKSAYTLLEACIVMLILCIFIAVSANVIPHKLKPKNQSDTHGRYECYYVGNQLWERTCLKEKCHEPISVDVCRFTPPKYIKFLILNAVGGSAPIGGSAGEFASTFFSASNVTYEMQPGKYGPGGSNGYPTTIYECTNSTCTSKKEVITAKGGSNTVGTNGYLNSTTDDIRSCVAEIGPKISGNSALSKGYICTTGPVCEIEDNRLKVSYCRTNELYRTIYLPYNRALTSNPSDYKEHQFIMNSTLASRNNAIWNSSAKTLTYYDTSLWDDYGIEPPSDWDPLTNETSPSLFKLTIALKKRTTRELSAMDSYIQMLRLPINKGIRTVNPGSIIGVTPHSGAVLLLW